MDAIINSPLFGILLTCLAFILGTTVKRYFPHRLVNSYLISMLSVIIFLLLTKIPFDTYNIGGDYITFLMGPATVALAVPLYKQWEIVRKNAKVIFITTITTSVTSIIASVKIASLFGAEDILALSLSVKSVTMPIAIRVVEDIGGIPSITIIAVALTGIIGTAIGPEILDLFRIKGPVARGLALGGTSHVLGTSRAVQEGETTGAFSGIALSLTGVFTALIVPFVIMFL